MRPVHPSRAPPKVCGRRRWITVDGGRPSERPKVLQGKLTRDLARELPKDFPRALKGDLQRALRQVATVRRSTAGIIVGQLGMTEPSRRRSNRIATTDRTPSRAGRGRTVDQTRSRAGVQPQRHRVLRGGRARPLQCRADGALAERRRPPSGRSVGPRELREPGCGERLRFRGPHRGLHRTVPAPGPMENPPAYTGIVDTHPYASLALPDAIYVADAGANAILRVGYDGAVSTVAVLPPTAPMLVTAELASAFGSPPARQDTTSDSSRCPPMSSWVRTAGLRHLAPGRTGRREPGRPWSGVQGQPEQRRHRDGRDRAHRGDRAGGFATFRKRVRRRTVRRPERHRPGLHGAPRCEHPDAVDRAAGPAAIELRHGKLYVTTDALADGKITIVPLTGAGHSEDDGT